jgi:hypothetical protein
MIFVARIPKPAWWILPIALLALSASAAGQTIPDAGHVEEHPNPFGFDLSQAWFDPWPHDHYSPRGTPRVHSFFLEPAFLERDLFLDFQKVRGSSEDETELAVELEWAWTRRMGLVMEMPFRWLDPVGAGSESGIGDFSVAPRLLLIETEAFLLAGNLEISTPSGSADKGLGDGEAGLAPSLSAWIDMGNWVQGNLQIGTRNGLESSDSELFYHGALAASFATARYADPELSTHDHAENHAPSGLIHGILEFSGRTQLDGPQEGASSAELLLGPAIA